MLCARESMQVFLRHELVDLLGAAVAGRRSGPVFAGREGGYLSARHVQRRFEHWLERAGIRARY
jgi:site-specific recombinase XerC